jgi:hypothetical protein
VAHAYEHAGPISKRLDDLAAQTLKANQRSSPWTSYELPAPPDPSFSAKLGSDEKYNSILTVTAKRALGPMTIEFLDHHRNVLTKHSMNIVAGVNRLLIKAYREPKEDDPPVDYDHEKQPHMVHFQVGLWHGYDLLRCMDGCMPWGWGELKPKGYDESE